MKATKSDALSFVEGRKESFKDRLKQLIGDRSVRTAAKDWGLSVSTLNNYLHRGTEPTLGVINKISHIENISIDWLANGTQFNQQSINDTHCNEESISLDIQQLRQSWLLIFDALDPSEANDLLKYIHRNGIFNTLSKTKSNIERTQLNSSLEDLENTIDGLQIRPTLKQAIKVALSGDESTDKEILHRLKDKRDSALPGGDVNPEQNNQKNVG